MSKMENPKSYNYPKTICITAVGTATSVGVIRNLRKYSPDTFIIGTDINPYGYTAGSMLVDKFYKISLASDSEYINSIVDVLQSNSVDYLFPINDTEIREVAAHRKVVEKVVHILLPSVDTVDLVQDKQQMCNTALGIGLKVPDTLNSNYSGKAIIRDSHGVGSKGIRICDSFDISEINPQHQFAQRYIEGDEYTVDILSDEEGTPLFIIPRLRIEVKSGVATKTKLINDQSLIDCCMALIKNIPIPGFSNVQFIKDSVGDNYFIEINPRIGGFSNASLLAAPDMFPAFLAMIGTDSADGRNSSDPYDYSLNHDVRWGAVVTRYYTDLIYEE